MVGIVSLLWAVTPHKIRGKSNRMEEREGISARYSAAFINKDQR